MACIRFPQHAQALHNHEAHRPRGGGKRFRSRPVEITPHDPVSFLQFADGHSEGIGFFILVCAQDMAEYHLGFVSRHVIADQPDRNAMMRKYDGAIGAL